MMVSGASGLIGRCGVYPALRGRCHSRGVYFRRLFPSATFRTRLAAIASFAVAAVVLTIAAISFIGIRHVIYTTVDNGLTAQARSAIRSAERSGGMTDSGFYGATAVVVAAEGTGKGDLLPVTSEVLAVARGRSGPFFVNVSLGGVTQRELVTPVPAGISVDTAGGPVLLVHGGALQLATPLTEVNRELEILLWSVLGAAAVGIVAAALLGRAVAEAALRPLDELTVDVEQISDALDGASRLDPGAPDELGRLRRAFNRLLDAVDSSQASQRQLIMDASHELRTPLTSLRTNVELLPRIAELAPEDGALLHADILTEVDELAHLIGNLTELVRGAQSPSTKEVFRLDEVVARAVGAAVVYGRSRDIRLTATSEPSTVLGHADGIERAVTNLLSNALKWGPVGSTVEVDCSEGRIRVRDEGPGVAPEDMGHVFDRFYRARQARGLPGSGLGLAIVAQSVEMDGGSVAVRNRASGGAEFEISLPVHDGSADLTLTGPAAR